MTLTLDQTIAQIDQLESIAKPMIPSPERSELIKEIARLYLHKAELIAHQLIEEERYTNG